MGGYLLSISYAGYVLFWLALVAFWAIATLRICWIALRRAYSTNGIALLVGGGCYGLTATVSELFEVSSVLLGVIAACAGFISGLFWAVDLWPTWKAILKSPRRLYSILLVGALLDLTAECIRRQVL